MLFMLEQKHSIMEMYCLPAVAWWSFIAVAFVNGCCFLCLLITGAQRMRSAMGATGNQAKPAGQQQADASPSGARPAPSSSAAHLPPGDKIEDGGSIVQVKSRENTVDFSEEVQTILDTGEIKLVKAMQKTTETQTDSMPVWFFGFDPTVNQMPPPGIEGPDGAMQPASHDVPAVDLSKFDQFSVVHYSDTRDPDNRKLVMIQTPGSKMYKPEELCSENLLVQNRPGLQTPTSGRRQFLEHRKAKSIDNSALIKRSNSLGLHANNEKELKRQERVSSDRLEADLDEGLHEGDVSFQDHDIDSGIWDMVHSREGRLSTRDATSPLVCGALAKDDVMEPEKYMSDSVIEAEEELPDNEETAKWQEMFDQLATSDSDRPTMSYRVFHIQDQVTLESVEGEDTISIESSDAAVGPLSTSTPKPHPVAKEGEEETEVELLHQDQDPDHVASDLDSELPTTSGGPEESFTDDSLSASLTEQVEDSGWLFDKIPAMQGSLIHSPTTPGSPKILESEKVDRWADGGGAGNGEEEDETTPTEVVEETISVELSTRVEGACVPEESGDGRSDKMRYNRDSLESTDTVTHEDEDESKPEQVSPSSEEKPLRKPTEDVEEDDKLDVDEEKEQAVVPEIASPVGNELFDDQDPFVNETDNLEVNTKVLASKDSMDVGSRSPSTGTLEETTVINISRTTSLTSNGDVYESCDEGPLEDAVLTCAAEQTKEKTEPLRNIHSSVQPRKIVPVPVPMPPGHYSPVQSPLSKPTSPLARTFASSGSGSLPDHGGAAFSGGIGGGGSCVVHRTGVRPKLSSVLSPQRRSHTLGLQSLLHEESATSGGTVINGRQQDVDRRSSWGTSGGDVYLLNRDGTLTNASTINSGVVYRSGARPRGAATLTHGPSSSSGGSSPYHRGGGDHGGLQGLNSLMVRSTSSHVVHSHVVTEMTAARAKLNIPELRRTPDRHSVASSDSEYASVDSSLATSPTSTSVEELASVGSDTCLLAEVMPVAMYPDWMANLPKRLHAVPLTQLAIPGSNISFGIESDMRTDMSFSKCNLEMAEFLRKLPPLTVFDNFRKVMKDLWRAWMPKQILSVAKQLEAGVRYLDIHITKYRGTFHGEHGLYTRSLKHYLRRVEEFIQLHPKEVVILHFQKFTNLTPKDKRALVTLLFQFFGAKLCRVMDVENLTLEEMWGSKKQIIAIFPESDLAALSNHIFAGLIWSNKNMRVSLPKKPTTEQLLTYLESIYDEHREPNHFHLLQAVVSPDMNMVFGDYAHKSMRSLTLHEVSPYLKVWIPGKYKLNIVAVDFVGIYDITGEIIRLNDEKRAETSV